MQDNKQGTRRLATFWAIVAMAILGVCVLSGCCGKTPIQCEAQAEANAEPIGLSAPQVGVLDITNTTLTVVENPEVTP